jgi:predicted transcriptional regulator of viral defense system
MRPHPDTRLADLASRQHGVVHRRQLLALGVGAAGVGRRVRAGRLHPVHRGVYGVGPRDLGREGRWLAAVLACGEGAVLSHGTAAALWGLRGARGPVIDVSVPTRGGRVAPAGVRLHRVRTLGRADTHRLGALPVTTPERTLEDLAAGLAPAEFARAVEEAAARGLLTRPPRTTTSGERG